MAPLLFYAPIAALALGGILATMGTIHTKVEQKCEERCTRIRDEAGKKPSLSKWTIDDFLDICEMSWRIREIRNSADKEILRVTWVLFAILGSSAAGLAISLLQTSMTVPFYDSLIAYIDIFISASVVVFIPILYKLVRLSLQKPR